MNSKLVACLVALVLLVGALWFFLDGGRDDAARGRGTAVAAQPSAPAAESPLAPVKAAAGETLAVAREEARPLAAPVTASTWRSELAGVTGRVVENDGTPVPHMRVALIELDASLLFDASALDEQEPSIELEETMTDGEGRFLLGGARQQAFHGLGIDLGGPRATIRMIDQALAHRERTDLGDVVLAPFGVLSGRVVDGSGAPLAGARVRVGPFPEDILRASPHEFRADSLIAVNLTTMGGEGQGIIELPDWVRRELERFPVPTTYSGPDGTFRLEGVALTSVVGGVDKREYVGLPLGPIDMSAGDHDVGDLVLTRGRTVRGVVEDSFGEPAAGIEVFAGAELFPSIAAILQPCGQTDAEGRFELRGVAESGSIVAAARRSRHEPWSTAVSVRHDGVLLEIQGTVQLTVHVRDEQGKPLSGARLQLVPGRSAADGFGPDIAFMVLPRPISPPGVFREVEEGRYVHQNLSVGTYDICARVPGLAPAYLQADCSLPENEVTLTCPTGNLLDLRVIDAVSKAPVAGARSSVMRVSGSGFTKVVAGVTDQQGQALLGPLAQFTPAQTRNPGFIPEETLLLVQHPRYGEYSASLETTTTPVVVALESGGALSGRVHWGGAIPTRIYMLTLEYNGADGFVEAFHMPRFCLTDLKGEFRLTNLTPGKYSAALMERFLDQDPFGLMGQGFDPPTLHRQEIEIENGETTELVIDLTPTGRGATARVVGHVRVDGRNLVGAEVEVRGNEDVSVVTDAWGRFETPEFSVRGSVRIQIEGEVPLAGGRTRKLQLHSESVELAQDDVHEIDLDLYPLTIRAQVVEAASGQPIPEAEVSARAKGQRGSEGSQDDNETNASGEATLLILQPGEYTLSASAKGFGKGSSQVHVTAQGLTEPASVRLPRSVPCAGRIDVSALSPEEAGRGFAYLHVQGEGNANSEGTPLRAPEYAFELQGLAEGKYRTWIYMGGRQGQQGSFELGPGGTRDLVLTFVPAEDSDD